jgi:hypothetical protein
MSLRTRLLIAVGVVIVASSAAAAQAAPLEGVRHRGPPLTRSALSGTCPDFVLHAPREFFNLPSDSVVLETRCTVEPTLALPAADGVHWMSATYRRVFVVPADSISTRFRNVTRDTAVLITVALYAASDVAGKWRAEWNATVDEALFVSITPTIARRPDGSALVSLRYCVNGTGGCSQYFLRRHHGQWAEVVQRFWTQIPRLDGGDIRGAGLDVRSLAGTYAVYGPTDANCCPSHQITITLDQRGDSLVLKNYRVRRR